MFLAVVVDRVNTQTLEGASVPRLEVVPVRLVQNNVNESKKKKTGDLVPIIVNRSSLYITYIK